MAADWKTGRDDMKLAPLDEEKLPHAPAFVSPHSATAPRPARNLHKDLKGV